jgi:hypothetical protein
VSVLRDDPPVSVLLTLCPRCGRNDRWMKLRARHYWNGEICTGQLVVLRYVLDPETAS